MDYIIIWPVIDQSTVISCEIIAQSYIKDQNKTFHKLIKTYEIHNQQPIIIVYYINQKSNQKVYEIIIANCYDVLSFDHIFPYPSTIHIFPEDRNSYSINDESKSLILYNQGINEGEDLRSYKTNIAILFSPKLVRLDEYIKIQHGKEQFNITSIPIHIKHLKNKYYRYKKEYNDTKKSIHSDRFQNLILICLICYLITCFITIHRNV